MLLVVEDFAGFSHHKRRKVMLGFAWLFEQNVKMPRVLVWLNSIENRMIAIFRIRKNIRKHTVTGTSSMMPTELMLPHAAQLRSLVRPAF